MPATDEDAVRLAKRVLRNAVRLRRDSRPEGQRRHDDLARLSLLRERLVADLPGTVACYLSTGTEPGTLPLIGWLAAHDCRILLPVLTDVDGRWRDEPVWADYAGPDQLRVGRAGIVEPTLAVHSGDPLSGIDAMICPGLAGARSGARLGRGGGWYDRVLGSVTAPVWLLLNDDEVLPELPTAAWDRPVDALVTPSRFLPADQRSG